MSRTSPVFGITAEEGPQTKTFCNPVNLMLYYKLNTCQFSCEEAEEEERLMPKWPTESQSVTAIHQGHQRDQQSMQATECTDCLHFQIYPQEIPHESERKTRDDGRKWSPLCM